MAAKSKKAERTRHGTIWSNLRWIHPQRTGRGTGVKSLKEKLKYFTYRDDRNVKAPRGGRRWVNHGLGATYREITTNCQQLTSDDRLAWTLMISPKPRLLMLLEQPAERHAFVAALTEDIMEQWFEARSFRDPAYSYVIHDRATNEEGLSQIHSHVILPGTVETVAGRERFDHRPSDLRQFNELVEDLFELHMDRQLGQAWRVQWAAIQREEALRKHLQEIQGEAVHLPAHIVALAEQLHAKGLSLQDLPPEVSTAEHLSRWLDRVEARSDNLDTWLGRVER